MLVFCLCFENSFGCQEDMEIWISNINSTFGKLTLYKYRSDVSPAVEQSLKMEKVQLSLYLFVGMSLRGFLVALQFCLYIQSWGMLLYIEDVYINWSSPSQGHSWGKRPA